MLDNYLFSTIRTILIAGLPGVGLPALDVLKRYQPTNQGINSNPTVYMFNVDDHRYGSPKSTTVYVNAGYTGITTESGQFITTESGQIITAELPAGLLQNGQPLQNVDFGIATENGQAITTEDGTIIGATGPLQLRTVKQQWLTTFQLSALSTQIPTNNRGLTAKDILALASAILQDELTIAKLAALDIGILRITDIRNPYFQDDREQNEADPSFDFVLTHNQTIISIAPAVTAYKYSIQRV